MMQTERYQVGDLIHVSSGDPLFDTLREAYEDAKRQHDEAPDDRTSIGIWRLTEDWIADLIAIYCDGELFRK